MAIFSIFRTRKNKTFHYQPLYYDERKERLEQRIKEVENEKKKRDTGDQTVNLREGFLKQGFAKEEVRRKKRSSNIRLLAILILLLVFVYYLIG